MTVGKKVSCPLVVPFFFRSLLLFPQDHLMFPRMLMKLVSLRTLSSVHSEQVFALRLQDKKLPPLLSEIWDVNEWLQTWCHSVALWSLRRTWHRVGTLTPFCPSGQGLVIALRFFFSGGRRASLPFALKQTAKWFGVHKKNTYFSLSVFFFFFWCRCWHDYGDIKHQHQALKPVISDLICWTLCQSHAVLTHPLRIIIRNFGAVFGWGCLKQDYGCTLNWNCDLKKKN